VRHFSRFSRSGFHRRDGQLEFFITTGRCGPSLRRERLAATLPNMRSRFERYYGAGDLHFITCSCYRRQPLLATPHSRDLLLNVLEQVRRRYSFVVVGYVIMPEHIHLLISEPQVKTPSTVMQALKLGFARRVIAEAERHRESSALTFRKTREVEHSPVRAQHVWQKRFYDFNVWTEHKRIEKLRYIHRNPVTRGLAPSPESWRWSSFRAYALGEAGPVGVNRWEVLKMRHPLPCAAIPLSYPCFPRKTT
jgi:REP-associated tyrosine transposase